MSLPANATHEYSHSTFLERGDVGNADSQSVFVLLALLKGVGAEQKTKDRQTNRQRRDRDRKGMTKTENKRQRKMDKRQNERWTERREKINKSRDKI